VQRLVGCERVSIFAKDPGKEEMITKSMDGNEVKEIRVPIASNSIVGYVALKKRSSGSPTRTIPSPSRRSIRS
jgi:hypothetical protein